MVTTTYNFKQWFKRHYPDITIYPIYGMEAYTFDKPMSPQDMYEYNVQQLPSGQYIVFVGRTAEQVIELMRSIKEHGLNYVRPHRGTPTTFSSFENWIRDRGYEYKHRTHCSKATANELLHTNETEWNMRRDWYMYEFDKTIGQVVIQDFHGPYTATTSGTVVILIKASTNSYVSKKQAFLQKFALMQPLFEQLVGAAATGDWDKANELAGQYASIQFDVTLSVTDASALKTAYEHNELSLFTRVRANFTEVKDGEF